MKAKAVTLVLLTALGAMAAGCTGGDDDDAGGTLVNGLASISLDTEGGQDSITGIAVFWSGNPVVLDSRYPLAGECSTDFPPDLDITSSPLLDAGAEVTVTSPAGSFVLTPFFPNLYIGGTGSAGLFVPNASHSITAPGGAGMDAYTHSQTAPGDLVVTAPDMGQSPLVIPIAQDLVVTWTPTGGSDLVVVRIDQEDIDLVTTNAVTCSFTDDGSGTIPAATLATLDPANPDNFITVSKDRFSTFDTSAGRGILALSRVWTTDVDVQ